MVVREKVGQPIQMTSGKRGFNISLYVDPEQMKVLEEIRWREHQSMSSIVRRALTEYIKAHGAGNETFRLDNWQSNPTFQAVPTILSDNERWRSHLKDCNRDEKLKLLKQANMIRSQIISVGLDKRR